MKEGYRKAQDFASRKPLYEPDSEEGKKLDAQIRKAFEEGTTQYGQLADSLAAHTARTNLAKSREHVSKDIPTCHHHDLNASKAKRSNSLSDSVFWRIFK